jgi:hypothetical protein
MKNYFLLLVLIGIWSCGPEDETPMQTVNDDFDTTDATLLREGTWMGSGSYNVSGKAEIYENDGKLTLYLDNFSSSSGPDLKVYLSTNTSASSFINLGKLKSTNGMQTYDIPAGTDVANFKFALIWCERFSVLFGKSETQ